MFSDCTFWQDYGEGGNTYGVCFVDTSIGKFYVSFIDMFLQISLTNIIVKIVV